MPIKILHCLRNNRLPFDTSNSSSTFSCDDSDEKDDKSVDNGKKSRKRSFGFGLFCRFYTGRVRQQFRSCVSRLGFGIVLKLIHRCYMDIHQMMRNRYYVLQSRCNAIEGLYDECSRRTSITIRPWRRSCRCSEYHPMRCIHASLECFHQTVVPIKLAPLSLAFVHNILLACQLSGISV